jgi:hypothetical protein
MTNLRQIFNLYNKKSHLHLPFYRKIFQNSTHRIRLGSMQSELLLYKQNQRRTPMKVGCVADKIIR